jgi:hypothetical protein
VPITGTSQCSGGATIEIGVDLDRNGVFSPSELTDFSYICGARTGLNCAVREVWDGGTCIPGRKVFATAGRYSGDLNGRLGADDICQSHAEAAGLSGVFRAWLGIDAENDPQSLFTIGALNYRLVNGNVVANSWADLTNGDLTHAIDCNEIGQAVSAPIWTQTNAAGVYVTGDGNCAGFTSATGVGMVGLSTSATSTWFNSSATQSCASATAGLYCIEQ